MASHLLGLPLAPVATGVRQHGYSASGKKRPVQVVADWDEEQAAMRDFVAEHRLASSYMAANDEQFEVFERFCVEEGVSPLPAEPVTVVAFLTAHATHRDGRPKAPATLRRYAAAIGERHRRVHLPDPSTDTVVKALLEGFERTSDHVPRQATPITLGDLARLATEPADPLRVLVDRAALTVGAATRRSLLDLVTADRQVSFSKSAARLTLQDSSTIEVRAAGDRWACPVAALRALDAALPHDVGRLFVTPTKGEWVDVPRNLTTQRIARRIDHASLTPTRVFDGRVVTLAADDVAWLSASLNEVRVRWLLGRTAAAMAFHGALKPTERSHLRVEDLYLDRLGRGLLIALPRSRKQPGGAHDWVAIPWAQDPRTCAVEALSEWLWLTRLSSGYLLGLGGGRRPELVADKAPDPSVIAKHEREAFAAAGVTGRITGRSARRGFCETAAAAGEHLFRVMAATRSTNPSSYLQICEQRSVADRAAPLAIAALLEGVKS